MSGDGLTIHATPCDRRDGEFLPFWAQYIEQNYRSEWVLRKTLFLKRYDGRTYIAERLPSGFTILVSDGVCATALRMPAKAITEAMTGEDDGVKRQVLYLYAQTHAGMLDRVERKEDACEVYHFLTPTEKFRNDVLAGRILDPASGLKLSLRQAQGRPPEGGFLQEVLGGSKAYYEARGNNSLGYYRGLVVKICGDYDPALREHHNTYGIITRIIDAYHYEVVKEYTGRKLIIRDTDVKAIIGDLTHDFIGIGEERHRREIIPIIRKALSGKIPIAEGEGGYTWPRPPIRQALVGAWVSHGKMGLKRAVMLSLKSAESWLKTVERRKMLYEPEDYRREHGKAVLWVRLYRIVLRKLERLERGEDVRLLRKRSWDSGKVRKAIKNSLYYAGIPYAEKPDGVYVCSEDYSDACRALQNVVV
jgi:hypothetical protein